MKQTAVRMDESMTAAAKVRAREENRSLGSYLRNLVACDLKKSGHEDLELADASEHNGKKKIMDAVNALKKAAGKKKK